MRVIGNVLRSTTLLATVALFIGTAALTGPAMADRPGTPTKAGLRNCPFSPSLKPRLCGDFVNTASEEVRFEIELKKNNAPASQTIDCFGFDRAAGLCWWPGEKYKRSKLDVDTMRSLVFEMANLDFDAEYCARFRTRRVSDDMVSEIWTGWSCARTPGPPSPPAAPEFKIAFEGRQPVPNGPSIPESLLVTFDKNEGAASLTLVVREANGADSYNRERQSLFTREYGGSPYAAFHVFRPEKVEVSPGTPWMYVEVCASNISGKNCSHKVVSAAGEAVLDAPPPGQRPIKTTGAPKDPTDPAFQPNTNLPGMDYRSRPLSGNDPLLCQDLCNGDAACKAWTFVKAGVQSARAVCWLKNDIPRPAHDINTVSGVKAGAKSANQSGPPVLYKVEMPGKDYRQVAASIFWDCRNLCHQEAQCKAWTWVAPGVQGPKAMCSLKNDVPARVTNDKAASGVKEGASPNAAQPNSVPRAATGTNPPPAQPAAPRAGSPPARPPASAESGIQTGIDMPGKDYRNVALNDNGNAPAACESLCAQEAQCKAWSWVKPGIQGPKAMCWLKNEIPPRVSNPNTASGLKVARGAVR